MITLPTMRPSHAVKSLLLVLAAAAASGAEKDAPGPPPTIAARSASLQHRPGFLHLYWDAVQGRLFAAVRPGEELIYQVSLTAGVGSNPIGLDRNQLGDTRLVRFERVGPKVLLVQPNHALPRPRRQPRPSSRRSQQSFASLRPLVVHGRRPRRAGGCCVDATDFFLRDAHGVAARLRDSQQGATPSDPARSAIYLPRTKAFPRNTEVEATITLVDARPARAPRRPPSRPTPDTVTVRQHHSFVQLPPPGYTPRRLDPRAGFFGIEVYDYASPFAGPLEKRFIARHRLQKKDPAAAVSRGRAADRVLRRQRRPRAHPQRARGGRVLVEGGVRARPGFRNAYEVRILPEDADPMDVRYNVINWVHRSTRGWSYGEALTDPRTGEILKGNVPLGSLRIRQDVT